MLNGLIRFALTQRLFVFLATLLLVAMGTRAWLNIPIDAFPDISPTQVKIIVKAPGMTTTEIESQITRLIELELLGIPRQVMLRSTTKYAITDITLDFAEGTDIYWARQQVTERLNGIWPSLPENISGGVAPMSTPLSEMFMFTVENPRLSLSERRELLDWTIRPALRSVPGVAEVNSLGGYVRTFEIVPDVLKLQQAGVSWMQLEEAVVNNNLNVGLGKIERGVDTLIVRTEGRLETLDDIAQLVIEADEQGGIIRLADVAKVQTGSLQRYGAVTKDGVETVQGLVIALKDSNAAQVVNDVKRQIALLEPGLPAGTELNVFYDRATLIETAVNTISSALIQAILLVILLLAFFLGHARAALTVSITLPVAALATFILMQMFDLTANLMSLGGLVIAIGMLVDASVVVVENILIQRQGAAPLPLLHVIYRATKDVAIPVTAGTVIVIVVFTPLLTLTGLEGKLFSPVALTIVFAMLSALLLSFTMTPVLASLLLRGEAAATPGYIIWLQNQFQRSLKGVLKNPAPAMIVTLASLLVGGVLFTKTGKSFMPQMDEGDIIVQFEKSPSITLPASIEIDALAEKHLLDSVPEVLQVVSRTGSDELGLDPMSLNETDVFLQLKPRDQWRQANKQELVKDIRQALAGYGGLNQNFTQPIQMRVSEMLTGSSGDVSIKIFGDNMHLLAELAAQVAGVVTRTQGSKDVQQALIEGGEYLNIQVRQEVARAMGMTVKSLSDFLLGQLEGRQLSQVIEKEKYIPLQLANSQQSDNVVALGSIADVKAWPILLPNQQVLPLQDLAEITMQQGPLLVERENARRFAAISANVSERDIVGFVAELRESIAAEVSLPAGYRVEYGGEFENQQRAAQNLMVVIPVALALIFIILFSTFRSLALAGLILLNIPFALVGGVIAIYLAGEYISVPASVGFIALLGVAVLNGVVMVSHFEKTRWQIACLSERIEDGTVRRLRPVLMTATTAMFGLMPLAFATGPGAEVQRPLAIVVIGGLVSSTLVTLYLLPVMYRFLEVKRG